MKSAHTRLSLQEDASCFCGSIETRRFRHLVPLLFPIFLVFSGTSLNAHHAIHLSAAGPPSMWTALPDSFACCESATTKGAPDHAFWGDLSLNGNMAAPVIEVWYGDIQNHGAPGQTQVWCNIPGNVSDDGSIVNLEYTLNGGTPVPLNIGPDGRRLANPGDFNVDPAVSALATGINTIVITAQDDEGNVTNKTVTVDFTPNQVWPMPYSIDWNTLNDITAIHDYAHVIDGKWQLEDLDGDAVIDGIRTTEPDYDRLIGIGNYTWTNYMVEVPVTIHSMPGGAGVGVLLRWQGHTTTPVSCSQPQCGYLPLGDIAWYRPGKLEFYETGATQSRTLVTDGSVTYMFRASVETDPSTLNTTYRLKVWQDGDPVPDLNDWDLVDVAGPSDLESGSPLLIAHQADVTFGNVTITPGPLTISDIDITLNATNTAATITWNTNLPATSKIEYGPTSAYEDGFVEDLSYVTAHSLTLPGLTADAIYHYRISGETPEPESAMTDDRTFSTYTAGIISDDFCDVTINPAIWDILEIGSGTIGLTGSGTQDAYLRFDLPAGEEHQMHESINAPYVQQLINNADFDVEIKYASIPQLQYQEQGIILKENDTRFIRFEFFHNGSDIIFYGRAYGVNGMVHINEEITDPGPSALYMRVSRLGDQWTMSYSYDGSFTDGVTYTFDHALNVSAIGLYAGNAIGTSSPAFTGLVDYFFNLDSPISPEDDCSPLFSPVIDPVSNIAVVEGSGFQQILTADDPDGDNANLVFSSSALPGFVFLNDAGNGSATLDINPLEGDAGTYPVTITVTDEQLLTGQTAFTILVNQQGTGPSGIHSDDFCTGVSNPFWTFVDPLGDGTLQFSWASTDTAQVEISVPAGVKHELWTNGITAPYLLQNCNDVDFTLQVKFLSPVSASIQEQGVIVRQDDNNFHRFEFYGTNTETHAFTANLISNPQTTDIVIGPAGMGPLTMRVERVGNLFTQYWSDDDGVTWTPAGTINVPITVTGVGIYAGNATNSPPAHTARIDYFLTMDQPLPSPDAGGPYVINEGASLQLDGGVSSDPDGSCGDLIAEYTWVIDPGGAGISASGPNPVLDWQTLSALPIEVPLDVQMTVENRFGMVSAPVTTTLTIQPVLSGLLIEESLQGRTDHSGVFEIQLLDPVSLVQLNDFQLSADAAGNILLPPVDPGEYLVALKHPQYLRKIAQVNLLPGPVTHNFGELRVGDANDDNTVSAVDFSILVTTYNKGDGDPDYDGRADFNGDAIVSSLDFSLMVTNYNSQGDSYFNTPGQPVEERSGPKGPVEATIVFEQEEVTTGDTVYATFVIEAGAQELDAAHFILDYNPDVLNLVDMSMGSALAQVLYLGIQEVEGRIELAAGALDNFPSGTVHIADFAFIARKRGTADLTIDHSDPRKAMVTCGGVALVCGRTPARLRVTDHTPSHMTCKLQPTISRGEIVLQIENAQIPDNIRIEVFNMQGQIMHSEKIAVLQTMLDLSQLNSGLYFMRIASGTERMTEIFEIMD